MNILYLNNEMSIGGVTKCILKLSKEFVKDNNVYIMSKKDGALLNEFDQIGIENIPFGGIENKSLINIIKNILIIKKAVEKNNIDIIHSHHRMTTLLAKIVSIFSKVRVIHTQHLCIEDKFKLTKIALQNIETVTVSNAAKRILVQKSGLNKTKITTIYNSIDKTYNNKDVDYKLLELKKNGYFIVAQISRAVDYKGVYDFLEIAKITINKNRKIRFVFIGDGPELENMNKIVSDNKLDKYVYLLGSKNDVIEHLKYIDVVMLCSYIEGLPLVPIEAFSQGVPVIATNINGSNEEVINGVNGYLVNKKDVYSFKQHILNLYNNRECLQKMSENCKEIYNELFNEKLYISKHKKLYEKELK